MQQKTDQVHTEDPV